MSAAGNASDIDLLSESEPVFPDSRGGNSWKSRFESNTGRQMRLVIDPRDSDERSESNSAMFFNREEVNSACDRRQQNENFHHDRCHSKIVEDKLARNKLIAVSALCFMFMIAEITGGLIANSLAIVSDASHLACDLAGFLVSLFAIWIAKKPPTKKLSFGYHRAEVIGALVSVLIIWIITAVLVFLGVKRIVENDYEVGGETMLITASIGVGFNILMGIVLHSGVANCNIKSSFGHGHSHSHGHSHGDHGHSHGHSRGDHGHSHGHSRGDHGHSHGHSQQSHDHSHGHSHGDHGHSHGRSHGDHGHQNNGSFTSGHNIPVHSHSRHGNAQERQTPPGLQTQNSPVTGNATPRGREGPIDDSVNSSAFLLCDSNENFHLPPFSNNVTERSQYDSRYVRLPNPSNDDDDELLDVASDDILAQRRLLADDCSSTTRKHKKQTNINVRAAMVHVIGDLVQSIGVLIAAIIINYRPDYKIADPICTFIFSFLVLCTTISILKDVVMVIMEAVPADVDLKQMKADLRNISGVKSVHSLNVWALTLERMAVSVHLGVARPPNEWQEILVTATTLLREEHQMFQSAIQVELYEDAMQSCSHCHSD